MSNQHQKVWLKKIVSQKNTALSQSTMQVCDLKYNAIVTSATLWSIKSNKCDVKMQMTSSSHRWSNISPKVVIAEIKSEFNSLFSADKLITNVEIAVQQSQRQYYACAQHYGENPSVMKTETFFGIFDQFNRNFNSLRQELNGLEL